MKRIFYLIIFTITFSALVSSCRKDDEATATKKELIARPWSIDQVLINSTPDTHTNYSDDRYIFNADGTYSIDEGNGNIEAGTWEFNSNETVVILDKGTSEEQTIDIFKLTDKEMIVELVISATWKESEKIMRIIFKK